jgi:hypothetical protein
MSPLPHVARLAAQSSLDRNSLRELVVITAALAGLREWGLSPDCPGLAGLHRLPVTGFVAYRREANKAPRERLVMKVTTFQLVLCLGSWFECLLYLNVR